MNTATAAKAELRVVEAAIPLLKEYTEKLKEIIQQAQGLRNHMRGAVMVLPLGADTREAKTEMLHRWKYLKPPTEELARQMSAMLEEGRIDGLNKVQLWLRLSEFEHYLLMAREAMDKLATAK